MKENKTWREYIKDVGGSKVAVGMGVKYPTVHKYIKPGSKTLPRSLAGNLCRVMKTHLRAREYKKFLDSLSAEATEDFIQTPQLESK